MVIAPGDNWGWRLLGIVDQTLYLWEMLSEYQGIGSGLELGLELSLQDL